jgi:hypothetical protein
MKARRRHFKRRTITLEQVDGVWQVPVDEPGPTAAKVLPALCTLIGHMVFVVGLVAPLGAAAFRPERLQSELELGAKMILVGYALAHAGATADRLRAAARTAGLVAVLLRQPRRRR